MSKYRSKIFVIFWFLLISLGQAYPYSVVYAHIQDQQCGCNLKGHKCIHGCHLKKKSNAPSRHHGVEWISPNCSQEKMQKTFSFQTEPFLPSPTQTIQGTPATDCLPYLPAFPAGILLSCDDPPPKGDEPPEDPA